MASELLAAPAPGTDPPAGERRATVLGLPAALAAAVGGGLLVYLAFPGYDLWALAPVGVAALVLAARGRRLRGGALVGAVFGLALVVPLISWTGVYLGPIAWLPLSVAESGYYALAGVGVVAVHRLGAGRGVGAGVGANGGARRSVAWAAARVAGVAGVWTAAEAVQARWPFGGFGWPRVVFSQADAPTAHLAALGGAPLVSFAVAAAGALLAEAVLSALSVPGVPARRGLRPGWTSSRALLPAAAAGGAAVALVAVGALVPTPTAAQEGTLEVAGVQGDVPRAGLEFNAQRRAVLDDHVRVTRRLVEQVSAGARERPDLVVWPENSSDIDPFAAANADAAAEIQASADAVGVPLLMGTLVYRADGRVDNTSLLWEPDGGGPVESYVKRHPVPFGEYIPFRGFFRLITKKVDLVGTDFAAGTRVGVLPAAGTRVGVLICFEVVEDSLVADAVDGVRADHGDGARVIVVQTNNATFGYTDESVQQLAMSRIRAIETGRAVVHVSTVGVSSIVMPDGRASQRTALFTPALVQARVPLRTSATVATWLRRRGVDVEALLVATGLVLAGAGAVAGRRRARPGGAVATPARGAPAGGDNAGRSHEV